MTVIELHPKPELGYWRCECGCLTFYLRNDDEIECSICEKVTSNGFWRLPKGETREEVEGDLPTRRRFDTGDERGSFDTVTRFLKPEATEFVVVALTNGTVRVWGNNVETRVQKGWLRRQLEVARKLLVDAS